MLAKQLLITVWLCLVAGVALPGQEGQPAVSGHDQKAESQAAGNSAEAAGNVAQGEQATEMQPGKPISCARARNVNVLFAFSLASDRLSGWPMVFRDGV